MGEDGGDGLGDGARPGPALPARQPVGKGKVALGPRARVEGQITSTTLAIAEGAVFLGSSTMDEQTPK